MKEKWENFSEKEIKEIIINSKTFKEVSEKFGYKGCNKQISDKIRKIAKERNLTATYLEKDRKKSEDYIGTTVNYLQIIDINKELTKERGQTVFSCKCLKCGKYPHNVLISCLNRTKSCGCLKTEKFVFGKYEDLTGKVFQSLRPIEIDKEMSIKYNRTYWKCECLLCGNIVSCWAWSLKNNGKDNCGCKNRTSKGEQLINQILTSLNITFQQEYSFKDFYTTKGHCYRYDFAIFNNEKLECLIEYHGKQHYKDGWKDKEDLKDIQLRDKLKREYCEKNNIPLIIIPYWDYKMITKEYLLSKIKEVIECPKATLSIMPIQQGNQNFQEMIE